MSLLWVSHYPEPPFHLCPRVTVMRDDRTVTNTSIGEASKLLLFADMLGRDIRATAARDDSVAAAETIDDVGAGCRLAERSGMDLFVAAIAVDEIVTGATDQLVARRCAEEVLDAKERVLTLS